MVFTAGADGGRGSRNGRGGAGGRGNQVERGSTTKQARNGGFRARAQTSHGKGRRGALVFEYPGNWRSAFEVVIKYMFQEFDEAIQRIRKEYASIPEALPAMIKPLIEATLQKHEVSLKAIIDEHKAAIKGMMESKGVPDEEYLAAIQGIFEELVVVIDTHASKEFLLGLLRETAAEQVKEAIRIMFEEKTN